MARVRNCPDVPIINSLFGLCLVVVVFVVVVSIVVVFVVVVIVVIVFIVVVFIVVVSMLLSSLLLSSLLLSLLSQLLIKCLKRVSSLKSIFVQNQSVRVGIEIPAWALCS